jgi:hypothetical protein
MRRAACRCLLIVNLLLVQALGPAHAHAGYVDGDTPHVHLARLCFWLPDAHGCAHDCDGVHDDTDEHDDAVDVPDTLSCSGVSRLAAPTADDGAIIALVGQPPQPHVAAPPPEVAIPPPVGGRFSCPLYIQTLSLLL